MSALVKATLERPHPVQVSRITHYSVHLHWEESLAAAEAVIGLQSADNRIMVIVQQLSPGLVEEWRQVYRCDYWLY